MRPVTPADAATVAAHRYPDACDLPERPVYAAWVESALREGSYLGFLLESGGEVIAGADAPGLAPRRACPHAGPGLPGRAAGTRGHARQPGQ